MTWTNFPDCFSALCNPCPTCTGPCPVIGAETLYFSPYQNVDPVNPPSLIYQPTFLTWQPSTSSWYGYSMIYGLGQQGFAFLGIEMDCYQDKIRVQITTPFGYFTPVGGTSFPTVTSCQPFDCNSGIDGYEISAILPDQPAPSPCAIRDLLFCDVAMTGTIGSGYPADSFNGTYPLYFSGGGPLIEPGSTAYYGTWIGSIPGYQPYPNSTPTTAMIAFGALVGSVPVPPAQEPITYGISIAAYGQLPVFDVQIAGGEYEGCNQSSNYFICTFNQIDSHIYGGAVNENGNITVFSSS